MTSASPSGPLIYHTYGVSLASWKQAASGVSHDELYFLVGTSAAYAAYLNEVQNLTREQGWAVSNPSTGKFLQQINAWGFPKYPDHTVILPPDANLVTALESFIVANKPFLEETNNWLGTWVHPGTGDVYIDVTTSCKDLDEALRLTAQTNATSKRKIIAVYNSSLNETVYL